MGTEYTKACQAGDDDKFRGEGDIPLTNIINSLTDDEFIDFC